MIIFGILIGFVTPFVFSDVTRIIMAAYWIFVVAAVFYLVTFFIKWGYYLCGGGKQNLTPWTPVSNKLNPLQQK